MKVINETFEEKEEELCVERDSWKLCIDYTEECAKLDEHTIAKFLDDSYE